MSKLFKFMTIAAVGVAIGTVASKLVITDKTRIAKDSQPAPDKKNQLKAENEKDENGKEMNDLDNCFI